MDGSDVGKGKGFVPIWGKGKGKGKGTTGKGNASRVQHPDFRWKGHPGCWIYGDEGHTAAEHKEMERKGWVPPTPSCKIPKRKRQPDEDPKGDGAPPAQRIKGRGGSVFNFYF